MSASDAPAVMESGPLGVICGSGSLPFVVARAAQQQGRRVILFGLRGSADPEAIKAFPHRWVYSGQFGTVRKIASAEGCREFVMIGGVVRPALREVRFDLFTLRMLPRIARIFQSGDNHLLTGIATIFEEHGFRIRGAHEFAPEILMPVGALSGRKPSDADQADIALGLKLLATLDPFDVGQAVVICDGRVLAIEAAEGTDRMLAQLAELRRAGQVRARDGGGVLVKAPKPSQDRRLDLPSIGPPTIEGAAKAGLAGIAIAAGSAVVAEPDRIASVAESRGIFVFGIGGPAP